MKILILSLLMCVSCVSLKKKEIHPFEKCVISKGGFTDKNCEDCEFLLGNLSESEIEIILTK